MAKAKKNPGAIATGIKIYSLRKPNDLRPWQAPLPERPSEI